MKETECMTAEPVGKKKLSSFDALQWQEQKWVEDSADLLNEGGLSFLYRIGTLSREACFGLRPNARAFHNSIMKYKSWRTLVTYSYLGYKTLH